MEMEREEEQRNMGEKSREEGGREVSEEKQASVMLETGVELIRDNTTLRQCVSEAKVLVKTVYGESDFEEI